MRRISFRPREYIASLLIFVLLVSQTIHVSFFDSVSASQERYRDIVSIFVDETTYDRLKPAIKQYAEDIQTSLGSTRVSIFVTDENTKPSYIANQNEKLYYEGDGEDDVISHLVGTILIGDIPVPIVDVGSDQFASMYPYTDFVDKKFLYNEKTDTYQIHDDETLRLSEPEIWHGVINPAVGRKFQPDFIKADQKVAGSVDIASDIDSIGDFLIKTHDFYLQKGIFSKSVLPPRVFYYDGFYESKSFDIQELGAYEVYMENAEQLIYERFSKHFLRYAIAAVDSARKKFNKEEFEFIDSLGVEGMTSDIFPDEEVDKTPDIQTKSMVLGLLKKFHQLINQKSLSDIRGFVTNAGRYNDGQDIRVDQPAVHVSAMDYSAMNTIRKANDKLEEWVDTIDFKSGLNVFPAAIFDYLTIREPDPGLKITRHYDNFLFGRKAWTIWNVSECTIARGSDYEKGPYKQGLLVEANGAFDVYRTTDSVKLYEKDAKKMIDCGPNDDDPTTYLIDAYWGRNIITNVNTTDSTFKKPSYLKGYYIPIFSLSGSREVNQRGFEVEHADTYISSGDPIDCDIGVGSRYTYMLQSGAIREDGPWPNDLKKSLDDISCYTKQEPAGKQPTWSEIVPTTRNIATELFIHFGTEGLRCENGEVAFSIDSGLVTGNYWACLPPEAKACYDSITGMGEPPGKVQFSDCFNQTTKRYLETLIKQNTTISDGGQIIGIRALSCDATPGKIFKNQCGVITEGNKMEKYYTKVPNGAAYQSACEASALIVSGVTVGKLPLPCMHVSVDASVKNGEGEGSQDTSEGGQQPQKPQPQEYAGTDPRVSFEFSIVDLTTYEQERFRLIHDSRLFHKSPSDEEIEAEKKSQITPSTPIDHDRHLTYMEFSAMNPTSNTIWYPNLFRFDEEELLRKYSAEIVNNLQHPYASDRLKKYASGAIMITAYRLELDRLGFNQYAQTAPSKEQPGYNPPEPPCWGGFVLAPGGEQRGRQVISGVGDLTQSGVLTSGISFKGTGSILSDGSIYGYGELYNGIAVIGTGPIRGTGVLLPNGQTEGSAEMILGTGSIWTGSVLGFRTNLASNGCVGDGPLSDEDIVSVIRSKRWLHPDVTIKMQQAVETGLSYSHEYASGGVLDMDGLREAMKDIPAVLKSITGSLSSPPKIPIHTGSYDVAYLGLTHFIPEGGDEGVSTIASDGTVFSDRAAEYSTAREVINAYNLSEQNEEESASMTPAPSDSCGPPEGVLLFEWPNAIMCWIKSQATIRIIGYACGANTLGLPAGFLANTFFGGGTSTAGMTFSTPISENLATVPAARLYYTGAKLTYHLERNTILPQEAIDAKFLYSRDATLFTVPNGSSTRIDILKIRDKSGKTVDTLDTNKYITIDPNPTAPVGSQSEFILRGGELQGTLSMQATMSIPTTDGEVFTVKSDVFDVRIVDEYLDVVPSIDGVITSQIPVTNSTGMTFDFSVQNLSGASLNVQYPIILDIYDDIAGVAIGTGITIKNNKYTLPTQYTRTVGVYRLEFTDSLQRHATESIAITPGKIARSSLSPLSSSFIKGSNTLVYLRLRDALGNPVAPDLYSVDVSIENGYFLLADGTKKESLHIDATESEIPLTVGSETAGTIKVRATIEDSITTEKDITVFESAKIVVSRVGTPVVGGDSIPVTVKVVDQNNVPLSGFQSLVALSTSPYGGTFSPAVSEIQDGVSTPIEYKPGQLAGDHKITASVPGLGNVSDIVFSVLPGAAMYISHFEDEDMMIFSLKDRYNNTVPLSIPGTVEVGGSPVENISFSGGIYEMEKRTGYVTVTVPGLSQNFMSYSDSTGVHTIHGIPSYTTFVKKLNKPFNFLEDYNARYTILAGGSFLREAEDILYNTSIGSGQSLAVTTLLDTPYKRDTVLSFSPGGGIYVGELQDVLPELTVNLDNGYPRITALDLVSNSPITTARYNLQNPDITVCTDDACGVFDTPDAAIQIESTSTGYTLVREGSTYSFLSDTKKILTISKNGSIQYLPGVVLSVLSDVSQNSLVLQVKNGFDIVGNIYYHTDATESILTGSILKNPALVLSRDTVYIDSQSMNFIREKFSNKELASSLVGYRFIKKTMNPVYDDEKNGPQDIDSIGMTVDTPGVGWKDNNRMVLSYAGGDTVGEASRWYQSYTLINLGDPVAHVDIKAPKTEVDGIDRTLGEQLTSSREAPVRSYAHRDMDNDGFEDIVVLHADGFVDLLQNLGDRIQRRGRIAYIPDISSRGFDVGDFTKDGFADLLGVDQEGHLILLSNNKRQFSRMGVRLSSGELPPIGVTQLKIRDMDKDTRDDIVYLTEGGELSILYGTQTPGLFDKKLLDPTLGITLSKSPIKTGGAIFMNSLPQVSLAGATGTGAIGIDEAIIWNEVYTTFLSNKGTKELEAEIADAETFSAIEEQFNMNYSDPENSHAIKERNFARIEYARAFNIDVSKQYSLGTGSILKSNEKIRVDIEIRNTGKTPLTGVEYLDMVPAIFSDEDTKTYTVTSGTEKVTSSYSRAPSSEYDNYFKLMDIPAGKSIQLSYELVALPASYGELLVGDFEIGETGADIYGDVGFNTDTTCGADMLLWRSTDMRQYERGTRTFSDPVLGPDILEKLRDTDQDGVLDSIHDISQEEKQEIFDKVTESPGVGASPMNVTVKGNTVEIGYDENAVDEMENMITDIYQTLGGCGRMKDGCLTFPINYAPLASGKDPVVFGYPIGDGFMVGEGVPMFSAATKMAVGVLPYCFAFPFFWPATPQKLENTGICSSSFVQAWSKVAPAIAQGYAREAQAAATGLGNLSVMALLNGIDSISKTDTATVKDEMIGAGGYIGIDSPANSLRIFATPTLTLGAGVGICFGGPARTPGGKPPPTVWPLLQMGNCLVLTDSLNICKNDGTIADVDIIGTVGLGSINETWNAGNGVNMPGAEACSLKAQTEIEVENQSFTNDVVDYIQSPSPTKLPALYEKFSQKTPRIGTTSAGPLIALKGASEDEALMSVEIGIDLAKPLTYDTIVDLKNKRIAGFPDFIMDWVTRQTDELINGFFTLPKLKVIPPTSIGQNAHYNGSITGTLDTWGKSFDQVSTKNLSEKMSSAYRTEVNNGSASTGLANTTRSTKVNAPTSIGRWMQEVQNSYDSLQDSAFKGQLGKVADQGKGGISAIRAAYKLIGNLPFISIREQDVPIDVPWILPQELDKYSRTLNAYALEVHAAIENYCLNDPSVECANEKAKINAGPLLNSINLNLKRIEEYKNFPTKIQKYIIWKQRYLAQILCYIEEVQKMSTGWLKDNSIRFRKWAELIVLLRAIADGWQVILDILKQKDAYCSVCHNERYNAKYWKYKLISLLVPTLPVIRFPRWPDIILDLHDIRLGVVIAVPNFRPNLKPIRLPNLPAFSLPRGPGVTIGALDVIPPLPDLPDLPDLPAIPTIKLPNIPPPLKLPKILDELKIVLKILKLWKLLECYYNKTPFVPEWTLGDVIAQRTERYGYLPIDFIDIFPPQIAIPWTREIRVSSHVNYEIRSEFITEFARAAVAPINEFTTDFGRSIPKKLGEDLHVGGANDIDINLQSSIDNSVRSIALELEKLEKDKDVYYDVDEFRTSLLEHLKSTPEFVHIAQKTEDALQKVAISSDKDTKKLMDSQIERYTLLRKYVDLQYDETSQLQNIVDLLTEKTNVLLTLDTIERAQFVSDESRRSSLLVAQKLQAGENLVPDSLQQDNGIDNLESIGASLKTNVKRLAANSASNLGDATANIAGGYSPNFQGIYIVTESGYQTRLFDYVELLSQDAPSTRTDIDNDGDFDYLYILDGALYLKRTTRTEPKKIIDTELSVQDIEENTPTAPDFFSEDSSLPGALSLSYRPAAEDDSEWRISLYDRYLEWDSARLGEDTLSPKNIIDILRHENPPLGSVEVSRSLARVEDPDDFIIEGPRMEVLTGTTDFLLSPGRTLYTGDKPATILYASGNTTPTEKKIIGAHRGYAFSGSMSIRLEKGSLYIVYPSIIPETYSYAPELIGMPILPGMKLRSVNSEVRITDLRRNTDIVVEPGAMYHLHSAREFDQSYPILLDYPNGYYHAMIRNLTTGEVVSAGESLFTPQLSSDTSSPDVNLRDVIRVPVYQTQTLSLQEIVTDTNEYTLTIDSDATEDTSGNGIYDDDFVSTGATITVTPESLTIGPYDTLGRKYMMLKVVDEFYNTTYLPVIVEIYSPIPNIKSGTMTGGIDGKLSEPLQNQPIDLFRVRPATDITLLSSGSVFSQSGGVFDRDAYQSETGVLLSSSGSARVLLSYLGLPVNENTGYQTQVVLASDSNPLHVVLSDASGRPLYKQYFALSRDAILRQRINIDDTATGALVISPTSGYTLVGALATDPNIPGGYYLVDSARRPLVAVARDGNIYPVSTGITATYSDNNGYPRIVVHNTSGTLLDLEYRFDFFYTAK